VCSADRTFTRARWTAGQIDAMGVVDKAIENGIGIGRVAEHGRTPQ
jgi:hypothetical protein